ncbi:hypothetical protein LSH36_256g06137 [Paralvinella palmiformis]|uniref:Methylosome subunit pICln n=1 Tax=Paralvinella palmiformis TaxID=53620 RepID=A0AAD9JLG1_9ANNE|nr:hypothetical protein LSH36_256g06137 [Paralvinella palmiformis]
MVLLTSFPPPTEGVVHREEKTEAQVQGKILGCGVLFVAESFKETTTNAADIVFVGEEQNGTTESSDEEDDIDKISEIRFIPEDKTSLDPIYKALTKCQELHPDEDESFSDAEGNEDTGCYDNDEDELHLSARGEQTLQQMEAMFGHGDNLAEVDDQPVIGLQANGGEFGSTHGDEINIVD